MSVEYGVDRELDRFLERLDKVRVDNDLLDGEFTDYLKNFSNDIAEMYENWIVEGQ